MSNKTIISTPNAPTAIGPYNQAVKVNNMVFLSGQLGLDPASGTLVEDFSAQVHQAFKNLTAVAAEAGATLNDVVKFTLFLTDLVQFSIVNEIMPQYVAAPFPARSTIGVAALPKGGAFEVEAIIVLPQ